MIAHIVSFQKDDLLAVKKFTDQWIGENYYRLEELQDILLFSQKNGANASLLAWNNSQKEQLLGVRLTYAPGEWVKKIPRGLTPQLWPGPADRVGYFKSLFIAGPYQQLGLGKQLSEKSMEILREMGAEGIVCHSWLESPGNSSQLYLKKMNFFEIKNHPLFWNHIDYHCTRCGPQRCVCTASEMYRKL